MHSRIKVCGLTRVEDAVLAIELGAWAIGFIFYEKSPRYLLAETAKDIIGALSMMGDGVSQSRASKKLGFKKIGVFVNAPISQVVDTVKTLRLNGVQLHGDESPAYCDELCHQLGLIYLIKVFRPQQINDVKRAQLYTKCSAFMIDTYDKESFGGTGQLAQHDAAAALVTQVKQPVILSGGLNAQNVFEAIGCVSPYAVDVSSGVESRPGVKSHEKMREFFGALRGSK